MWWEVWILRRASDPIVRLGVLVKLIYISPCGPHLALTKEAEVPIFFFKKKLTPWEYTTVIYLGFFLNSVVGQCCLWQIQELEYVVFPNLLQGNLCNLFYCSGNLFLVLNGLTKIEFMALFNSELKHSWDFAPEIKLLSGAFLHWNLHRSFQLLLRINFPSDIKQVSVLRLEVVGVSC